MQDPTFPNISEIIDLSQCADPNELIQVINIAGAIANRMSPLLLKITNVTGVDTFWVWEQEVEMWCMSSTPWIFQLLDMVQ